jgi:arabinose-5-phosphate isomerase
MDYSVGEVKSRRDAVPSLASSVTAADSLAEARQVLQMEAEAILATADRLSPEFIRAVDLMMACTGKVVVTGMGKSGHIACKIAATFASTGTPAFFVHPAELRHGDFGMLDDKDVVVALSGSGETQEIKLALDPIKRLGIKIIALTGNLSSTLARFSDVVIDVAVDREACPLNLAPTSSTTVALAVGDALAVVLMGRKNFSPEDFARSHPGGNLGRSLLTVRNVMRTGMEVPIVKEAGDYGNVLSEIDQKRLGFTCVCDDAGRLVGMITDGDLRRAQVKWGQNAFSKTAGQLMSANPKTIGADSLAAEALKTMEKHLISDLLIVDENHSPVGLIDLKDLLRAGII